MWISEYFLNQRTSIEVSNADECAHGERISIRKRVGVFNLWCVKYLALAAMECGNLINNKNHLPSKQKSIEVHVAAAVGGNDRETKKFHTFYT